MKIIKGHLLKVNRLNMYGAIYGAIEGKGTGKILINHHILCSEKRIEWNSSVYLNLNTLNTHEGFIKIK